MQSNFETIVADARAKHVESLLTVADGDSHRHARIKGTIAGLDESLKLYRQAHRLDAEQDAQR